MASEQPFFLGLKLYELLTLLGIVIGPIAAVLITLWVDDRRRDREQKIVVLRHLLATRHLPADPGFLAAINLIPVEFNEHRPVITAYNEFIEASRVRPVDGNDDAVSQNTATKLTRLIFEISQSLRFKIRETDIQTTAYASDGWIMRDRLNQDSQQAMRDIADILWMQTRMLGGESWEQVTGAKPTIPSNSAPAKAEKKKQ